MDGVLESVGNSALWPSFESHSDGHVPVMNKGASWDLLNPDADDGLRFQLAMLLQKLGSNVPSHVDLDRVDIDYESGPVYIDETAIIGPYVKITGPCYIGPRCEVRHSALIRKNTWACSDTVIGHSSEIKHSLLLPTAKAPHFNYVGDSILGSGVNLGAGVKLSNLRHDGKEIILKIGGSKISTGLRKFGALIGEGCQLGCNSVTNPGVILGCDTMVVPNATVSGVHDAGSFLT